MGVPKLTTAAKVAALLLIFAFIGTSTYFVWQHQDAEDRQHKVAAFIAGAKQGVVNMTSLDFKKAKDDVQRVIDSSTGEFRDDFQQRAADFTKVVEQSKVVTEGAVNAAAVETMDGHSAQVLVSATSRVTNAQGAKDEPRSWRLRVTVTEEDGQYKMSKVEFVP
jgi:Mce-associated membrane protein